MFKTELPRKILYTFFKIVRRPKRFIVFLFARFQLIRNFYCQLLTYFSNKEKHSNIYHDSIFPYLNIENIVKVLKKDSLFLGIYLPQKILEDVLNYTNHYYCFAGGRTNLGFKISDKEKFQKAFSQPFYVARYFNVSMNCPSILRLAYDPVLQTIATKYIGSQAKYTGASLYWTFPTDSTPFDFDQQEFTKFHYDLDDFASLRFCFYLSNVTLQNGPHICIRGSHKKKSIRHVLNYFSRIQPEHKLIEFYGDENFITLLGNAGFRFIEDTFCFHKGTIPTKEPRLFLQLHFATSRYSHLQFHESRDPSTLIPFI
jgi:hypothetical protein